MTTRVNIYHTYGRAKKAFTSTRLTDLNTPVHDTALESDSDADETNPTTPPCLIINLTASSEHFNTALLLQTINGVLTDYLYDSNVSDILFHVHPTDAIQVNETDTPFSIADKIVPNLTQSLNHLFGPPQTEKTNPMSSKTVTFIFSPTKNACSDLFTGYSSILGKFHYALIFEHGTCETLPRIIISDIGFENITSSIRSNTAILTRFILPPVCDIQFNLDADTTTTMTLVEVGSIVQQLFVVLVLWCAYYIDWFRLMYIIRIQRYLSSWISYRLAGLFKATTFDAQPFCIRLLLLNQAPFLNTARYNILRGNAVNRMNKDQSCCLYYGYRDHNAEPVVYEAISASMQRMSANLKMVYCYVCQTPLSFGTLIQWAIILVITKYSDRMITTFVRTGLSSFMEILGAQSFVPNIEVGVVTALFMIYMLRGHWCLVVNLMPIIVDKAHSMLNKVNLFSALNTQYYNPQAITLLNIISLCLFVGLLSFISLFRWVTIYIVTIRILRICSRILPNFCVRFRIVQMLRKMCRG